MSKYDILCIGDYHIKDLSKTPYDIWQYDCYIQSFKNITKIVSKYKVKKLILSGDTWDNVPKHNSLELFALFMQMLKSYNLEIYMIAGNHTLMSGIGKNYYEDIMKEYFKINYNISVLDYKQIDNILYCSHKHIKKLEKLNKPVDIVISHFRSNIPPISDEIDVAAINKNAKLCILGDIHHRNSKDNIVYTGSPIDTHFDGNNNLEHHTPSVLLLNEETLEWKWLDIFTTSYRKCKRIFTSVDDFLRAVPDMRDDKLNNHNFYKCVVQDKKVRLNTLKTDLYSDFCIIQREVIDLEIAKENKKIATEIVKNLSTTDVSAGLLEFILKNNDKVELTNKIKQTYHKYEVNTND